jgi:hypothetical protein
VTTKPVSVPDPHATLPRLEAAGYRERVFVKSLLALRYDALRETTRGRVDARAETISHFRSALHAWRYDPSRDEVLEPHQTVGGDLSWRRVKVNREGTASKENLRKVGLDDLDCLDPDDERAQRAVSTDHPALYPEELMTVSGRIFTAEECRALLVFALENLPRESARRAFSLSPHDLDVALRAARAYVG